MRVPSIRIGETCQVKAPQPTGPPIPPPGRIVAKTST